MAAWLVGGAVVLLGAHVAVLLAGLVRAALPSRRGAHFAPSMLAAGLAVVGELALLLRLFRPDLPTWPGPALVVAGALLALAGRAAWREDEAGRAARQAVVAVPLAALLLVAVALP